MFFQCINFRQVPREVLKTSACGLGFQHLPRDLANVNTWKTMFDPYSEGLDQTSWMCRLICAFAVHLCLKTPFRMTRPSYDTDSTEYGCKQLKFSIFVH